MLVLKVFDGDVVTGSCVFRGDEWRDELEEVDEHWVERSCPRGEEPDHQSKEEDLGNHIDPVHAVK